MKKFILSIAISLLFTFETLGHVDHYAKYNYLEYELFRNNQSIGYHKYNFINGVFPIWDMIELVSISLNIWKIFYFQL